MMYISFFVKKLCEMKKDLVGRRNFIKGAGAVVGGLALSAIFPALAELPGRGEVHRYFDDELADLDLPVFWSETDFVDKLGVISQPDIALKLDKSKRLPYDIRSETERSELEKMWREQTSSHVPGALDVPTAIINASPFKRISIDEISGLSHMVDCNGGDQLENLLYHCPPCTAADVYPERIELGEFGEREKSLFSRAKEAGLALDRIDELKLQYGLVDVDNPRHDEIVNRVAELTRVQDDIHQNYYYPSIVELLARTSMRNLMEVPSAHPESVHHHPDLDIFDSLTHCYGWVTRVVDLLAQIKNKPEISPVISDENGNFILRSGKKKIDFDDILEWFTSFSELCGWHDSTEMSYDELIANGDHRLYVCFGTLAEEDYLGDYEEYDHVFIARKLAMNGEAPVMVAAELVNEVPRGRLFHPIDPNDAFKIVGNSTYKVKKYSINLG